MRRRSWLLLAAGVAAAVAVTAGVVTWNGPDSAPFTLREYPPGDRPAAPPISGELLDGGQLTLADLRGDVLVVNVWGSWCVPCRVEKVDLEYVYQATQELGVAFVGVNIRDGRDKAVSFAERRVSYPSIFDPAFEIGLGFSEPPAPIGPPATLVIDRDGGVAAAIYRVVGRVELEQLIKRVAAEPHPDRPESERVRDG